MGVNTESERGDLTSAGSILKRAPVVVTFLIMLAISIPVAVFERKLAIHPLYYPAVHKCVVAEIPKCTEIGKPLTSGVTGVATEGHHFGLNKYGQNTTAVFNCRARMIAEGGDTFAYYKDTESDEAAYVCKIFTCDSAEKIPQVSEINQLRNVEVWSQVCPVHGHNNVIVHLMEWRWDDIAAECKNFLGPSGYTMVQVSPPTEHALGSSWDVRYNPTSYKLESRSGDRKSFVNMVKQCRESGVNVMVDAIFNHMAAPFVQSPERDAGKACNGEIDNETHSSQVCRGWTKTQYFGRNFPNGREHEDKFKPEHFHHYRGNIRSNCGLPPWTNNRHLCDLYGLPDLDTESPVVRRMMQTYLWDLYQIGVVALRIDASQNMYPQSVAMILEPFPWEYVVQEYYPGVLQVEPGTLQRAMVIGSITDSTYGQRVAEGIFPAAPQGWPDESHEVWEKRPWTTRDEHFRDLLQLDQRVTPHADYNIYDSPTPEDYALIFLDNHDQQRVRWDDRKVCKQHSKYPHSDCLYPENGQCWWNGRDIGNCRPVWRMGQVYNLAQLFMLAWPYGDAVRLGSSWGWQATTDGPPGVAHDSLEDRPSRVNCRVAPPDSPARPEWVENKDSGKHQQYWICEHKWEGIAGMVRFRRLTKNLGRPDFKKSTFHDQATGVIGWSMGDVGFVALNKQCKNWFTKHYLTGGSFSLVGQQTGMPEGKYCNLAGYRANEAVPGPEGFNGVCPGDPVVVGADRKITSGSVDACKAVAIHVGYKQGRDPGFTTAPVTNAPTTAPNVTSAPEFKVLV